MLDDSANAALIAVIEPVCTAHGVELVDVSVMREPGGAVMRILIDREMDGRETSIEGEQVGSGVSLADCQGVSRDLSVALDVNEAVAPKIRYRLEVSSPGLDRPLTRRKDFEKYAGKEVRVQTRLPISGEDSRRKFNGVLKGLDGDRIRVEDGPAVFQIPLSAIAKANVVYRFAQKSKP